MITCRAKLAMIGSARWSQLAFAALLVMGATPTAFAQQPNETALARQEFRVGVEAARSGDWEAARAAFERAYALQEEPCILLNLARAQSETGQLVATTESYRRFLRIDPLPAACSDRASVEQALADVLPRLARVRIRIAGLAEDDVVTLDDQTVSHAALGRPLPIDPGQHVVTVRREGTSLAEERLDADEGSNVDVELVVEAIVTPEPDGDPRDSVVALPAPRPGSGSDTGGDDDSSVLASPWLWLTVGVVVVAAVSVGLAFALADGPNAFCGTTDPCSTIVP